MIAAARFPDGVAAERPPSYAFGGPPRRETLDRDEVRDTRLRALVDLQGLGYSDVELRAVLKIARTTLYEARAKLRRAARREVARRLSGGIGGPP